MSELIFITKARLSFPNIVEPQTQTDVATGKVRITYSADLILPQGDPAFTQFMQQYLTMATVKWSENAQAVMQMIQTDRKTRCYGQGNEKIDKKTFKPYSGYAAQLYITAIKDKPPQMIQDDGVKVPDGNTMAYQAVARKMYGGCYVNAAVRPWLQENKFGRGVRCDLIALQFCADGEAFGEGDVDASSMFGAVAGAAQPTPLATGIPWLPAFFGN